MRTIKRYNNRKLYDTKLSKYITLDDIKTLVTSDINFEIIDNTTKNNLTKRFLLTALSKCEFLGVDEIKTIIKRG